MTYLGNVFFNIILLEEYQLYTRANNIHESNQSNSIYGHEYPLYEYSENIVQQLVMRAQ